MLTVMAAAVQRARVNVMLNAKQTIACRQGSTVKVSDSFDAFCPRWRFCWVDTLYNVSDCPANGLNDY